MEILICHSCGSILKGKNKTCPACGAVSRFSPTSLPVMSESTVPLKVTVKPDPAVLEQIVSKRQMVALLGGEGGNGTGKQLLKRVVYLDPTYKGNILGYNPLEMPEDEDLQSAASSLVHGFKPIYTEPPGAQSQWN